jgi:phosphoribosylaminoimidazole-succinocarboxamide synthase
MILKYLTTLVLMQTTLIAQLVHTIESLPTITSAQKISGKVRESYQSDSLRAMVVTDRISAFDFVLGTVPFKGQVLNNIAAWWFGQLDGLVPHHFVSMPHPNISVVKKAEVLPVEVVVRSYLTGSTKTSSWYAYNNLERKICGLEMPAGMKKNEKFAAPIITPTTKPPLGSSEHDVPITRNQIVNGMIEETLYAQVEAYALKMFALGQKKAAERGMILVDTKYEFGLDAVGDLMVIDEVHTPDSSRYWIANTYEERMSNGEEPDMLDKEFVRRMVVGNGYDVNNDDQNPADFFTEELRIVAAEKYLDLYERMTGQKISLESYKTEDVVIALEKVFA